MTAAYFQIGKQDFPLQHGIYLVCGPKATNLSVFTLQLQHESVENKHALIYVEENGFSLLDLQTKTGTFLNGTNKLEALKKTTVTELDKICFGNFGDGVLRYASLMEQKSSGFHDTLHTSANSTINTSNSSAKITKNMNKTDSFNIPETQVVQPDNAGFIDLKKCNGNDDSIPETQEVQTANANVIDNNKENVEGSEFLISTQEFNETFGSSLHDNSADLLKHLDFIIVSQATTVPVNVPNPENIQNPLNVGIEASSVEMEALNWSTTNTSKAESVPAETHDEIRSTSVTPDLFEPFESTSFNAQNEKSNNTDVAIGKSVDVDVAVAIQSTATVTLNSSVQKDNETNDITTVNNVKENQPLQLSNKENMEDLGSTTSDFEPTQRYVPKKDKNFAISKEKLDLPGPASSLVDSDLEPTQVFVSKKDIKQLNSKQLQQVPKATVSTLDTDLEPTQVFVPKKVLEGRITSTPLQTSKRVTEIQNKPENLNTKLDEDDKTAEKISNQNLANFFKQMDNSVQNEEVTPEKSLNKDDEEQLFPNVQLPESEFLLQTPQFIADVFNTHEQALSANKGIARNLCNANEENDLDVLEAPFKKRKSNDFDKLIESIQKNVNSANDDVNDGDGNSEALKEGTNSLKIDGNTNLQHNDIIDKELNSKPTNSVTFVDVVNEENVKDNEKTLKNQNSSVNVDKALSVASTDDNDDEEASNFKVSKDNIQEINKKNNEDKQSVNLKKYFKSQVVVKLRDIEKQRLKEKNQKEIVKPNTSGIKRTAATRNLFENATDEEETGKQPKTGRLRSQSSRSKIDDSKPISSKRSKLEMEETNNTKAARTTKLQSKRNNVNDVEKNAPPIKDNDETSKGQITEATKSVDLKKVKTKDVEKTFSSSSDDDEVIVKLKDIEKERLKKEKDIELKKSSKTTAAIRKLTEDTKQETGQRTLRRLRSQSSDSTKTNSSSASYSKQQINPTPGARMTRLRSRNDSEVEMKSTSSVLRSTRLNSTDSSSKTDVSSISSSKRKIQNSTSTNTSTNTNDSMLKEKIPAVRSTRLRSRNNSEVEEKPKIPETHTSRLRSRNENEIQEKSSTSNSTKQETQSTASRSSRLRSRTNSEAQQQNSSAINSNDKASKPEQQRKRIGTKIDEIDKKRIKQTEEQHQPLSKASKVSKGDEQPTTSKGTNSVKKSYKIMFTMVQPEKQNNLVAKSKNFWQIAKNPMDMQVLVMDSSSRTVKFLIAMAKGLPIVTTKWVELFNTTNSPSMSSELMFNDKAFEKEFNFSMLSTLNKANMKKIFENTHFMLTEKILPQQNDMKVIIQAAGGVVHQEIPANIKDLYLISSKEDSRLWHSFRRKNPDIIITSAEAVMLAIMRYDFKLLKRVSFN